MDAAVWSKFPSDLLVYQVIPCLSFFYRLSLRSVCRHWNWLFVTKFYMDHCQSKSASSFLVLCTDYGDKTKADVYDSFKGSWFRLPKPFVSGYSIRLLTSAGGLVCFQDLSPYSGSLFVCNPVLNKHIILPQLPVNTTLLMPSDSFCLSPNEDQCSFLLLLTLKREAHVYCSTFNCWINIPSGVNNIFESGTIVGSNAYFLAYAMSFPKTVILKYDIFQQQISQYDTPDYAILYPKVFELFGQIVLIGKKELEPKLLRFWMFDANLMEWSCFKSLRSNDFNSDRSRIGLSIKIVLGFTFNMMVVILHITWSITGGKKFISHPLSERSIISGKVFMNYPLDTWEKIGRKKHICRPLCARSYTRSFGKVTILRIVMWNIIVMNKI